VDVFTTTAPSLKNPSQTHEIRFSAKLDSRGRLVVPAEVRKKLGLSKDDALELEILATFESYR